MSEVQVFYLYVTSSQINDRQIHTRPTKPNRTGPKMDGKLSFVMKDKLT